MYISGNKYSMIWKMLSVIVIPVYVKHLDIDNEIFIVSWINRYAYLISCWKTNTYWIMIIAIFMPHMLCIPGKILALKIRNYKHITMAVF